MEKINKIPLSSVCRLNDSARGHSCYNGATVVVSRHRHMTIDIPLLRGKDYRKRIYVSERKCKRTRDIL
jgi:hypothetical protein